MDLMDLIEDLKNEFEHFVESSISMYIFKTSKTQEPVVNN